MRAFYIVATQIFPDGSSGSTASLQVGVALWDGVNPPTTPEFSIVEGIEVNDTEADIRKKVVDQIAAATGVSKHDIVNCI